MIAAPTAPDGPVADVPMMGRPGALLLLGPAGLTISGVMGMVDGRAPAGPFVSALALVVIWVAVVVSYLDRREARVSTDGTVAEVAGRWTRTRFALADVTAVIDARVAVTGPLRVDGAVRTLLGRRLPRLVPWPQQVSTYVHPAVWVRSLGIPEDRVRGGGLAFRRRGLR